MTSNATRHSATPVTLLHLSYRDLRQHANN